MKNEAPAKADLFPVRLMKNYVPRGEHRIVGYHKAEVRKKTAGGQWMIESPADFVQGEMHPAPFPGTGFGQRVDDKTGRVTNAKIWADTVIELPRDEAMTLVASRRAERADDFPAG